MTDGKIRKRLEQERADLRRLAEATEGDAKPVELDQTKVGRLSRMDAMQVQAMAAEAERRREYGYCTACGDEISAKRLDSDPAAPLCIACAGKGG